MCFSQEIDLSNSISIEQTTIDVSKAALKNGPFSILIEQVEKDIPVYIFASFDEPAKDNQKLPIGRNEISFFPGGGALAAGYNKDTKTVTLYINSAHDFNIFFGEQVQHNAQGARIDFDGIADRQNRIYNSKVLYLVIYVDLNEDRLITENEIAYKTIALEYTKIIGSNEARTYRSSMGRGIGPFKTCTPTKYIYFHITSNDEASRFKDFVMNTFGDHAYLYNAEFMNDYTRNNYHVVFSPMSNSRITYQPYTYNGDDKLIFEMKDNTYTDGYYIFIRSVRISKEVDEFSAYVDDNGVLNKIEEMK